MPQHVVEEAVLLVKQRIVAAAHVLHRIGDVGVVLQELRGQALVDGIRLRQFQGDPHHRQGKHSHPTGRIGLLERGTVLELLASIEDADVVEAEKAPFEHVVAVAIDFVHPAREIQQQLVVAPLQPGPIFAAMQAFLHVVDPPDSPGMHGRIQVAELPLVGGQLAAGMLELLEEQKPELVLRELRVDQRERDALEGEIPGREPGIFPGVGHGEHPQ